MKRGKKLILLASILALLVIVTVVVQNAVTKNEAENTEENTPVTFLTVDPDAVTALQWTYNGETVSLASADGVWTDADDAAFPVDQSYPAAMLDALKEVTASRSFASGDESEYGLDAPACTITVSAGTDTTLTLGSASEISGEYYASIGDGKVYLVDTALADPFAYGLMDILQMESIPEMAALDGIDIATASGDLKLEYWENSDYAYTDAYHWFLTQNGTYRALGDAADTLADSLKGLSWIRCENYNATADDLAAYGLDKPSATVTLTYTAAADTTANSGTADSSAQSSDLTAANPQEQTFVLEIGGFTDGGYYARIQGSPMVYLIDSSLAQSLFNATYESLRPTDVCLLDWDTVTSFDVTLDGQTYVFERSAKDVTGADGAVTQEDIFLMNGAEVDSDLVNAVLDTIYGMASTGTTDETPGAAEIAFTFHRSTDTFTDISLTFYRLNSATCIAGFNGETSLAVARADVVSLTEAVNAILLQ